MNPQPSNPRPFRFVPRPSLILLALAATLARAAEPTPEQRTFFETKIRPVLVTECYDCHAGEKHKGGLRLDSRDALRRGGDTGAAVVPGNVADSLLITSIRHEDPDFKMPKKAPKLDDAIIADFTAWVKMGAPDPRDKAEPVAAGGAKSWPEMLAARRGWWSLQPVVRPATPAVKNAAWPRTDTDIFLLAKMEARGLAPAPDADARTIIRRMTFAITGLPPTADEASTFAREYEAATPEKRSEKIGALADRLLASPRFGEHWARHWMDLVRYAESHGSEGDPEIPQAWRYRDYLIRAFNADVPCDQLIREHLAGDLLAQPRWNRAEQFNESKLGLACLRLGEHGFQPIDTFDEQIKTVDNQIDVIAKAFQGLTISCARCHDHKFDAISQRDYYALFGVLASSRPAQVTLDAPELLARRDGELSALKGSIRDSLASAWQPEAARLAERLTSGAVPAALLDDARKDSANPLHAWARLGKLDGEAFAKEWAAVAREWREKLDAALAFNREHFRAGWDFVNGDDAKWSSLGAGLYERAARGGEFSIEPEGDRVLDGLRPAGVMTDRLSRRHNGHFTSPRFKLESDSISVRATGGGGAWVRVICDNYPLPQNPTFPRAELKSSAPGWVRLDTAFRKGHWAYLEFVTNDDLTRREGGAKDGRSWFAAERVVFGEKDAPREEPSAADAVLAGAAPRSAAELAARYGTVLADAVKAWRMDAVSEPQRALLDFFIRRELLPSTLAALPSLAGNIADYRRLESDVPLPRRAPGVIEGTAWDAPLLPRGEHTKPGAPVPRGYLEVLGTPAFSTAQSGRSELAAQIASAANPLTARVMANRIWLHLFGRGLVPTPDNFGRMGEKPTHPELLDFLATRLVEDGWSCKKMIRYLVTSRAFLASSEAPSGLAERDATNELLAHARVRRLDAEAIRDSMLAISGRLDSAMFGASLEGNSAPRRSVYLRVQRGSPNLFLEVFDAPKPYTTLGRRDSTNVPAQSLALLNDPFVIDLAKQWAAALIRYNPDASPEMRVQTMFTAALGREASADELSRSVAYLVALGKMHGVEPARLAMSERVWQDFAQSVFNLKEFIYVR